MILFNRDSLLFPWFSLTCIQRWLNKPFLILEFSTLDFSEAEGNLQCSEKSKIQGTPNKIHVEIRNDNQLL